MPSIDKTILSALISYHKHRTTNIVPRTSCTNIVHEHRARTSCTNIVQSRTNIVHEHRTSCTKHRARNTVLETLCTKHRARSTVHETQCTKHCASCIVHEHGAQTSCTNMVDEHLVPFRKSNHCARVCGARIDIRYAYEAESPEDSESVKQSRLRPFLGGQN